MKCDACGTEILDQAKFCHNCGEKLLLEENSPTELKPKNVVAINKGDYVYAQNNFSRVINDGHIYYINRQNTEIWRREIKNPKNNTRLIIKDEFDKNEYIGVNKVGIFTYYDNEIYIYSFSGNLLKNIKLNSSKDFFLKDIFIYDRNIACLIQDNYEEFILYIDLDDDFKESIKEIYRVKGDISINRLFLDETSCYFELEFKALFNKTFWLYIDLKSGNLNLLNPSQEYLWEMLENPQMNYDYEDCYSDDPHEIRIFTFDIENKLVWTHLSNKEIQSYDLDSEEANLMLFSRKLDRSLGDVLKTYYKVLPDEHMVKNTYLFNGKMLYYIENYFTGYSILNDGKKIDILKEPNYGHGKLDSLQIGEGYLIGDLNASNKEYIYEAELKLRNVDNEFIDLTPEDSSVNL